MDLSPPELCTFDSYYRPLRSSYFFEPKLPLELKSSYFFEPKLPLEYDVLLTFFNDDLEEYDRVFLQKCLKDARFKTSVADISKVPTWEIIKRSRIVVVIITPKFIRSNSCLNRLVKLKLDAKTLLPFFYGVSQNDLREQFKSFYVIKLQIEKRSNGKVSLPELSETYRESFQGIDDSTDLESQRRANAVCSSLFDFTLPPRHSSDQKAVVNDLIAKAILQLYKGMVPYGDNLVKVFNDKVHVHDLQQDVGRRIVANKPKSKFTFDVFLSFRGEDTRKTFATYLYNALKQSGIKVFMDDEGIDEGEDISNSLLNAIENSRISIIIFSTNYAGSSWCLQELEKIMECYKTFDQNIFPIFYYVQPSDVRKKQNAFGEAWEWLITGLSSSSQRKTKNWEKVLTEAANLKGWDMQNYRNELELLQDVVKTTKKRLDKSKHIIGAHHRVVFDSCVQANYHQPVNQMRSL